MFDDQEIERSATIAPSLTQAMEESRISIVILSKKYGSSSWCLDELVKILECKKVMGQKVMTVFYGVEPSDVRKQIGEFGIAFHETCESKTDEQKKKWSNALNEVANIAGEDFKNWDNEAKMIKKIARDVSAILNATPSKDFDNMVGLEAHLREMVSLLDLDNEDEAMIFGISGPAGIGKTTIARALQSLLSYRFQHTCFIDLRGSNLDGLHDYGQQLRLQEQLLSKVLNQDGMRICHLGVLPERLCDLRVLIILDDVNDVKQLNALAKESTWFGPGSRIVITSENKELLQQHGIRDTYHVGFPSSKEALKILCRYAFKQTSPCHGFEELAETVTKLCDNLPLGLCVMGSSLRGKKENEWENVVKRLKTTLDPNIEDVLRVGYESLDENEQELFLHIAVFFNNNINGDLLKTMFEDHDLDIKYGLKILENRSLIEIRQYGDQIVMHRLLQQVGKKAIRKQEPWKRQILIDANEICDVLEDAKGTSNVFGISFDISRISEVSVHKKAFKKMPNLRFLRVYKSEDDGNYKMYIPEEMELPCRLRLLDWEAYPSKSLPPTFNPEYLVKLDLENSQLKKLWRGIQPLTNLKHMNLSSSIHLEELPDLSKATNLEELFLSNCESLVEIPSSFSHLQKLERLRLSDCKNLQVIPPHMNLASLEWVVMDGCSKLRNIPLLSTNVKYLYITVEDVPQSIRLCSLLTFVSLTGSGKLKGLTHLPKSVYKLDLSSSDYERIPDCIKVLHQLKVLYIRDCRKLTSLPELPCSLIYLDAENCESLETVFFPLNNKLGPFETNFTNCAKLGQQAQKAIIGRSFCYILPRREVPAELDNNLWDRYIKTLLPGREVPAEFDHRAIGSSLTIVLDGNFSYGHYVFCVVLSPYQAEFSGIFHDIRWRIIAQADGYQVEGSIPVGNVNNFQTGHLFIVDYRFQEVYRPKVNIMMTFEFSSNFYKIIECGAKILTQEDSIEWSHEESGLNQVFEDDTNHGDHTNCWNWMLLCFDLSHFVRRCQNLCFWKKKTIESETDDVSIPGLGH